MGEEKMKEKKQQVIDPHGTHRGLWGQVEAPMGLSEPDCRTGRVRMWV